MRGNPSGYVTWPTHLRDNNEGGLVVLALWRCTEDHAQRRHDPFCRCFEATSLRFHIGESNVLGVDGESNYGKPPLFKPSEPFHRHAYELSVPVLGVVQLGSSSATYVHSEDDFDYWRATRASLTLAGAALVEALDALYGRPAQIVTILDT